MNMDFLDIKNRANRALSIYDDLIAEKASIEASIRKDTHEVEKTRQAILILQELYDQLITTCVKSIADTVTVGLQAIFHDQNLVCVPIVEKQQSRVQVEFRVKEVCVDGETEGDILTSFGGGVAAIVDMVLRLYALIKSPSLKKFLALDESLGAVSDEYIPATVQFIKEFCKTSSVDVLLVTHKPAFSENADLNFQVQKDSSGYKIIKTAEFRT